MACFRFSVMLIIIQSVYINPLSNTLGSPSYSEEHNDTECFINETDVVHTTDNGSATFYWQTKYNSTSYSRVGCKYGNVEVFQMGFDGKASIDPTYHNRISASMEGNTIKFTLENVTENDTINNYIADLLIESGHLCQSNARLYLYRLPKQTTIEVDSERLQHTEGDAVTLTCTATHSSIPEDLRLPLVYSWTVGGTDVRQLKSAKYNLSGTNNDQLILTVSRNDADIECVVREEGSPLTSLAEVHLLIEEVTRSPNQEDASEDVSTTGDVLIILGTVTVLVTLILIIVLVVCLRERCVKRFQNSTPAARPRTQITDDDEHVLEALPAGTYSSIRASSIVQSLSGYIPGLPPRDSTYNQPFEDMKVGRRDLRKAEQRTAKAAGESVSFKYDDKVTNDNVPSEYLTTPPVNHDDIPSENLTTFPVNRDDVPSEYLTTSPVNRDDVPSE